MRHYHQQQYTAAVKTSSLEPTANALNKLGGLVSKDAKLVTILEAPTLSAADKSAIVAELEKSAGAGGGGETVKNFLQTLAENNRLSLLGGVCTKFSELMSAARGEVEMTVTSATVCASAAVESSAGHCYCYSAHNRNLARDANAMRSISPWTTRHSTASRLRSRNPPTSVRAKS